MDFLRITETELLHCKNRKESFTLYSNCLTLVVTHITDYMRLALL